MVYCPICHSCDTGKVAQSQYYCWHCLMEFSVTKDSYKYYYVESDGSLVDLEEPIDNIENISSQEL